MKNLFFALLACLLITGFASCGHINCTCEGYNVSNSTSDTWNGTVANGTMDKADADDCESKARHEKPGYTWYCTTD